MEQSNETQTIVISVIAAVVLGAAGYVCLYIRHAARHGHGFYADGFRAGDSAAAGGQQSSAQGEEATRRHIAAGLRRRYRSCDRQKDPYYRIRCRRPPSSTSRRKSPFMNMMLVPVLQTATPTRARHRQSAYSAEPRRAHRARVEGFVAAVSAVEASLQRARSGIVQRARPALSSGLHVRATLDRVAKGQPLVDLHVPTGSRRRRNSVGAAHAGHRPRSVVDGARQRMRSPV